MCEISKNVYEYNNLPNYGENAVRLHSMYMYFQK